ncbi:MAG: hypothetical protein HC880_01365 [Bacteroidia bacterium]|nr:hypothetical protein [Bacteroidia bacterium]
MHAQPTLSLASDAQITTSVSNLKIGFTFPVHNYSNQNQECWVRIFIGDAEGKLVQIYHGSKLMVDKGKTVYFRRTYNWEDIHLWFPHDPYLYQLHIVLYDTRWKPIEYKIQRFGVRELSVDGTRLFLNGGSYT